MKSEGSLDNVFDSADQLVYGHYTVLKNSFLLFLGGLMLFFFTGERTVKASVLSTVVCLFFLPDLHLVSYLNLS
jgi:hypothetical protein